MRADELPEPLEHDAQVALLQWWGHVCGTYGLPEFALFAVPNGSMLAGDARLRAIQMQRLKKEGLRPGTPDLFLAAGSPHDPLARGLFIELKRKPNKPSDGQKAFLYYLRTAGYHAFVCYGTDEGIQVVKSYLKRVNPASARTAE